MNAEFRFLSGAVATGPGPSLPCDGVAGFWVRVSSVAGSSATVEIQGSIDENAWIMLATFTNPTAAGDVWSGEPTPFMRANVTEHTTGTISAVGSTLDVRPGRWHQVSTPA